MDQNKQGEGYVYILTNPSFREDWVKIGMSSRAVGIRPKELDNTSVPLPFKLFATLSTDKYIEAEKLVHRYIDRFSDRRIRQNREFFNVTPLEAVEIFKDVAPVMEDAVVEVFINGKAKVVYPEPKDEEKPTIDDPQKNPDDDNSRYRHSRFRFSLVGIKIGEELVFTPTGIKVKVCSDNQIEYEGQIFKLSPFVGTYMPEDKRNTSGAYQGAKFFSYKGRLLTDLRKEFEDE